MKSTPENKIKLAVKKILVSKSRMYFYSATAGPYSTGGIPDIIGCYNGQFFGIEVKAPGRRGDKNRGCSALQQIALDAIVAAGGFSMVYDGEPDDHERLMWWLNEGAFL